MTKKFYCLLLAAFSFATLSSCMKEGHGRHGAESKSITLNVAVNAGENYQLNLRQYGDADDLATITKQAVSYITSAISRSATGDYIYTFAKEAGSKTGDSNTEQVILKVYEPQGRCRNNDETNITINFTIK